MTSRTIRTLGLVVSAVTLLVVATIVHRHPLVFITGDSMRPSLRAGDICVIRRGAQFDVGDAVLVRGRDGDVFVHRVVRVDDARAVRTRGDANPIEDMDAVSPDRIVGPVVGVVPLGQAIGR